MAALTPQQIFTKYQVLFADNDVGAISEAVMRDFNKDLTDYLGAAELSDIVPAWTALLTFQTDGSDDGQWCTYPDTSGNIRIWQTKIDDNIGNEPPADPQVTEDTNWIEVSASSNSSFSEYVAGLYGAGLIIVFKDDDFYKLQEAQRPFNSEDFAAELAAGKWLNITKGIDAPEDGKTYGRRDAGWVEAGGVQELQVQFASNLDTVVVLTFRGKIIIDTLSSITPALNSVSYEVSSDGGDTWTSKTDIAAVNTYCAGFGTMTTGTQWRLKCIAVYYTTEYNIESITLYIAR